LPFKNHGFRWTAGLNALAVFGRSSEQGGTRVTNVNREHKLQRSGRTLSVHLPLCSLPYVKTTSQALGPGQHVTRDVARGYI